MELIVILNKILPMKCCFSEINRPAGCILLIEHGLSVAWQFF